MYDKLLAPAVLFLVFAAGSGCAMCDPHYPYGPTPHGGYYGRAGSALEPMAYGAVPPGAPGQTFDGQTMQAPAMQAESMDAESVPAEAMDAESMPIE